MYIIHVHVIYIKCIYAVIVHHAVDNLRRCDVSGQERAVFKQKGKALWSKESGIITLFTLFSSSLWL